MRNLFITLTLITATSVACGTEPVTNMGAGFDGGAAGADGVSVGADGTARSGTSALVDKGCVDGKFAETFPNPSAPIDDLIAGYKQADHRQFVIDVLKARYPFGATLVQDAPNHPNTGEDCIKYFIKQFSSDPTVSAQAMLKSMGVWVHECGHFYDVSGFSGKKYAINGAITLNCKAMGGADSKLPMYAGPAPTSFPRSFLTKDKYVSKHPGCTYPKQPDCDGYLQTYLGGDPDNGKFESGDQGFNLLMEEAVQYVNSLATAYAFADLKSGGVSHTDRDGILNFLWYVERYLHLARTAHPEVHKAILADACWRELILTVWGRGWLYLEATKDKAGFGIQDKKLEGLVKDPVLLGEIELVRAAHGC
ncbi:MAG: hypothetical protein KC502_08340 [Myxococcales bacterium]|nr:hypothetical protein [Myxococcales bacterium]